MSERLVAAERLTPGDRFAIGDSTFRVDSIRFHEYQEWLPPGRSSRPAGRHRLIDVTDVHMDLTDDAGGTVSMRLPAETELARA